jgi:hypothetical protein
MATFIGLKVNKKEKETEQKAKKGKEKETEQKAKKE